jgi:S-adenosylmethionine/arginine decarboxylase-like enzyme
VDGARPVEAAEVERAEADRHSRRRRRAARRAHGSTVQATHSHLSAEFIGVPASQLRDGTLISGLLIAAASAVGFSSIGVPAVRDETSGSLSAALSLESGHMVVHAVPERQILLFDVVSPSSHDCRKAVDVFSRRLTPRDVRTVVRDRG